MAKDKSEDPTSAKKEKKDKKDKKRKHSEVEPAAVEEAIPVETPAKKEKKEKKEKKRMSASAVDLTLAAKKLDGDVVVEDATTAVEVKAEEEEEAEKKGGVKLEIPIAALVPFANPLCDEKAQKKVLKSVKKAAKNKALKRGVKEVVKAIRKSPPANPTTLTTSPTSTSSLPSGIVILAADISPMDVISHLPVLCEDHNIPYLYVPSRAELGAAGSTKRPTSVVMLGPKVGKGVEAAVEGEWEEGYREVWRLAVKLGQRVKV